MSRRGILIIQSMGLGDIFFAIPVIQTLKREFPDDPLIFVTHERHREILEMIPQVDKIITYRQKNFSALLQLISQVRQTHARMAVVLNPVFRGALLACASQAPIRLGYSSDFEKKQSCHGLGSILLSHPYQPANRKMHETDRSLDLLRLYGLIIQKGDREVRLPRPAGSKKRSSPQVIINLGTGWKMRQWPPERIARTADYLSAEVKASIVFSGGPQEQALAQQIQNQMTAKAENLCGKTSLNELAEHLGSCDLFITPDTGSLHLAAALHVPTLALFGPGDLEKVMPRSQSVKILYHPIPCSPCRVQYTNQCRNNLCMQEISVEEVLGHACEMLGTVFDPSKEAPCNQPAPTKKYRILYLQSTSEIGGTDVTLLRTLQALNKQHFEPHVILHKEGPLAEPYRQAGALVHFVPSMRKLTSRKGFLYLLNFIVGYLPAVFKVTQLIRDQSIDLVHSNTIHNLYGFAAAFFSGKPHVWHVREIVVQSKWFAALEYFLVKKFSSRFLVMDQAIAAPFAGKNTGFPSHIRKIYDGIDLEQFKPGKPTQNLRAELNLSPETPLVGIVCRLDQWKGVDRFIEAAAMVQRVIPKTKFWICGGEIEGHEGYESILRKKATDLGIGGQILFTGWRYQKEQIADVYRSLSVSVQCPRHPEPYGLANLEAMACGIPAVAFNEGGPSELCREGALLVTPQSAEALAQEILRLLEDKSYADKLGQQGRRRAESLFDAKKCTAELEAIYLEILETQKH